jgi:hypothetical protein
MSSYLNLNELAESPTFRGRIQAAIAVKAAGILGETEGTPKVLRKRHDLALAALKDPAPMVNGFVWLVVTNGDVKALGHEIDDDALAWVVGWAWDQVAGVTDKDREEPVVEEA